jgi:hypothetical protein
MGSLLGAHDTQEGDQKYAHTIILKNVIEGR